MFENIEVMELTKMENNKAVYYDTPNETISNTDIFKI